MRSLLTTLCLLLALLALGGCGAATTRQGGATPQPQRGSPARIKEATLTREVGFDFAPISPTLTFSPTDTVHLVIEVAEAPEGTDLRVAWSVVEAQGVEANRTIAEHKETLSGNRRADFTLSNDGPFPQGRYKADVYLDEIFERAVEFQIGP